MPLIINQDISIPDDQLEFRFSRSSGPGGQNVNKVHSRVELTVRVATLPIPRAAQARLARAAGRRLSIDGRLTVSAQTSREQTINRRLCLDRLAELIRASLIAPKRRVPTRPGRAARQRRLDTKKQRSQAKALRRPPG